VHPAAGPGYFLVGDAAFVLDPASSHGMLKALMSGMMAAHLAADVIGSGACAGAVAERYDAWLTHWFRRDCEELRRRYAALGGAWSAVASDSAEGDAPAGFDWPIPASLRS
jgi:flavin-dependent dehydrogenase